MVTRVGHDGDGAESRPVQAANVSASMPALRWQAPHRPPDSSYQAADPRGAGPGVEASALRGFLRRPDLLEGCPVIGRALRPQQPRRILRLEVEVHLEPAVIRSVAV